ncbi:hypothetical protein PSPO01_12593 [Paraphaeosphaeria sporulosa]
MKLPKATAKLDPQSILHIDENSHLIITLHTTSTRTKPRRAIQRADNVIIETPRYHSPGQSPPPTVFLFRPAPVIFHLPSTDARSERNWKKMRKGATKSPWAGQQQPVPTT